jgi:uncharacterized protein (DUF58 family)
VNEVEGHREAPPVGEEVHLPGPSILPLLSAISITLIVVGTTTYLVFIVIGLILFIVTTIRWILDTRRDVGELPEEHLR